MNNKTIYIISESFSLKDTNELSDKIKMSISNIIIKDDKSSAKALLEASKKAGLIIMINYNFTPIAETINIIKNLIVPIIYCSIDNLELQNKKNKITSLVPYVIHGFKEQTNNILLKTIEKILK